MSRKRVVVITAGLMLSLFLASMEITVVATATPTIVSQLGGLAATAFAPTQELGSSSARPTGAESAGEPVRTTLPGP